MAKLLEAKASLWFTPVRQLVSQSVSQSVTLSRLSHRGAFASPPSWMGLFQLFYPLKLLQVGEGGGGFRSQMLAILRSIRW